MCRAGKSVLLWPSNRHGKCFILEWLPAIEILCNRPARHQTLLLQAWRKADRDSRNVSLVRCRRWSHRVPFPSVSFGIFPFVQTTYRGYMTIYDCNVSVTFAYQLYCCRQAKYPCTYYNDPIIFVHFAFEFCWRY